MERSFAEFYEPGRWRQARGRLKKLGLWIWGAVGLGAILGTYVAAVVNEVAPAPKDLVCLAKEQFRKPAPGTQFTILISNLVGDPEGKQTELVRDAFLNEPELDVRSTCRVVQLDSAGSSLADAERKAWAEGRALLRDRNADLLIGGKVREPDKRLNLWFLNREDDFEMHRKSYELSGNLSLPTNFKQDLAAQLEAVALSQIVPPTDAAGGELARVLKAPAEKLRRLLLGAGDEMVPRQDAALLYRFGEAASLIGKQTKDVEWLQQAVIAYTEVVSLWSQTRVPLGWAAAQQAIGDARYQISIITANPTEFENALEAYRNALREWVGQKIGPRISQITVSYNTALQTVLMKTRDVVVLRKIVSEYRSLLAILRRDISPDDWASTKFMLGAYLEQAGALEGDTASMQEAIDSFRAALQEGIGDRFEYQIALGLSIAVLGWQKGDTVSLEQAIAINRAVLEGVSRDKAPSHWARAQSALGISLALLGWQKGDTVSIEQAITVQRAALELLSRDKAPSDWAETEDLIGALLVRLGKTKGGTASIEQAIGAHRAALEARSRDKAPSHWASTQDWLGAALRALGEQEGNTASIEQAIGAHRAALEARSRDKAPSYWADTQDKLGAALRALGEQKGDTASIEQAIAVHRAALEVRSRDKAPSEMTDMQVSLRNALRALGEQGEETGGIGALDLAGQWRRPPDKALSDWADTQDFLGNALRVLGWQKGDTASIEQAIAAHRAALSVRSRARAPLEWADTQEALGKALGALGEQQNNNGRVQDAITSFAAALEVYTRDRLPFRWAMLVEDMGDALKVIGGREAGTERLEQAVTAYRAALEVFRPAGASFYVAGTERNLARAEALLAERRGKGAAE
jgi:tetratricopeptide (TPR) repeat protein